MSQVNRGDYLDTEYASCDGYDCKACRNLHPWRYRRRVSQRCLLCGRFTVYFFGLNGWAGLFASCTFLGFLACERCVLRLVTGAGLPGPPWADRGSPLA